MCTTIYWEFKAQTPFAATRVRQHVTECVESWVNISQNNVVEVTWSAPSGEDYTGKVWSRRAYHTLVRLDFPERQMAVMFKLGYMRDEQPGTRY